MRNVFHGSKRPALVSPEGATLDPSVIEALTGHAVYAQAGSALAGKVVGHVAKMTGSASIVRNGVTIVLNNGDAVYQNDVVQTGSGSTLGLVLTDGTTFNLSANARLMSPRLDVRRKQYVELIVHHAGAGSRELRRRPSGKNWGHESRYTGRSYRNSGNSRKT